MGGGFAEMYAGPPFLFNQGNLMNKLILLLVLAALPAWATNPPDNRPPPKSHPIKTDARANSDAQADANAHAGAEAQAEGGNAQADAQGGQASSSSSADGSNNSTTSTSNESNFFALSTTFPQVSGCFKGAQGGAGASGGGLWFGRHGLDLDCFYSQIAEAEPEIEVQARLKCGSKAFRNAIAFESPSKERQRYCVDYMTAKHRAELERMKEKAAFYMSEKERIERELTERNTILARQCAEAQDRTEEAWLECLKK